MPKIIKNGKEYSGVPIEVVTAWAPTADPVQVKEPLMGNTDISDIGDGTVTGAIDTINTGLTTINGLFKTITVSSNTPRTIQTGAYATLLFLGFAQGIGGVAIAVKRTSSAVTAYDVTTGSSFSSTYLKFEFVSSGVKVTSTNSSNSVFTVILGGL